MIGCNAATIAAAVALFAGMFQRLEERRHLGIVDRQRRRREQPGVNLRQIKLEICRRHFRRLLCLRQRRQTARRAARLIQQLLREKSRFLRDDGVAPRLDNRPLCLNQRLDLPDHAGQILGGFQLHAESEKIAMRSPARPAAPLEFAASD